MWQFFGIWWLENVELQQLATWQETIPYGLSGAWTLGVYKAKKELIL